MGNHEKMRQAILENVGPEALAKFDADHAETKRQVDETIAAGLAEKYRRTEEVLAARGVTVVHEDRPPLDLSAFRATARTVTREELLAERNGIGQRTAPLAADRSRPPTFRSAWRRPAAELLLLVQQGRFEVATDEDRVLLGDLRAALEDIPTD
jgi:hypothetical protein